MACCYLNWGSYTSASVLLYLLNEFGEMKRCDCEALPSILLLFLYECYKFNETRTRMQDSIYHLTSKSFLYPISHQNKISPLLNIIINIIA